MDEIAIGLANLPPGQNPFTFLRSVLLSVFPLPESEEEKRAILINIYVVMGLLGVSTVLILVFFGVRIWKRAFWLFRMMDIGPSTVAFIRPHGMLTWAVPAVVLTSALEAMLWQMKKGLVDRNLAECEDIILWLSLPWIAAAVGGFNILWSVVIGYLSHLASQGRFIRRSKGLAICVNTAGVVLPLFEIATIVGLSIPANAAFHKVTALYRRADSVLAGMEATWTPDTPLDLLTFAAVLAPQAQAMTGAGDVLVERLRELYFAFFAWVAFLFLSLVTVSTAFIFSVRRTMIRAGTAMAASDSRSGQDPKDKSWVPHAPAPSNNRSKKLARAQQGLVYTLAGFSVMAAVFMATSLFIAVRAQKVYTDFVSICTCILLIIYVFTLVGIPSVCIFIAATFETSPLSISSGSASRKLTTKDIRTPRALHLSPSSPFHFDWRDPDRGFADDHSSSALHAIELTTPRERLSSENSKDLRGEPVFWAR